MGDTPSQINKPAQTVDQIIHFILIDLAVQAGEKALIAYVPFLGAPGISIITDAIFKAVANWIYQPLALVAVFRVIEIQTDAEKRAYANAEQALRTAHLSGDTNALNQATADFKKALAGLVHWDGIANP